MTDRVIEVVRRGEAGENGAVGLINAIEIDANTTVISGYQGYALHTADVVTLTLSPAASVGAGFHVLVSAQGGDVTLARSGSDLIDGATSGSIPNGASAIIYTDGSEYFVRYFFGSGQLTYLGLPSAANKMLYSDGVGSWVEADITAAGRALLDDAAASNQRTTLGLGELSEDDESDRQVDQADWNAGTATDEGFITPSKLQAKLNHYRGTRESKSGGLTTTSGAAWDVSFAHGLSSTPQEIFAWIVCTSADLNYSVGDIVSLGSSRDADGARAMTLWADATNAHATGPGPIYIGNKSSTYANAAIDSTKWDLYIGARLI